MTCIDHPQIRVVGTVWALMTSDDGREALVSLADTGNPLTTVCPGCRDSWMTMVAQTIACSLERPVEIVAFERRETVAVFGAVRN